MSTLTLGSYNDALVKGIHDEVLHEGALSADAPEKIEAVVTGVSRAARENGKRLLDVLDFEYLFEQLLPEDVFRAFDTGRINDRGHTGDELREHVASTIKSGYMDKIFDTCVLQVLQDFSCPEAPFALRDQITTPVSIDCNQERFCEAPMPNLPDFCCMGENEATPYYGVGNLRCWKTPQPCKIKFAFGFNREMLCKDPNGFIRGQIDRMGRWFDEMDEYALIRMVFDVTGGTGGAAQNCRFPFIYNDTQYNAYLVAADNGPWTNKVEDANLLVTGASNAPLIAIETLIEDRRDPDTGRPIDCLNNLQVLIPVWADRWKWFAAMGPRELTFGSGCTSGNCTDQTRFDVPARDGWNTTLLYSRHAMDILRDYYDTTYNSGTANASGANSLAGKTYVVGNFKAALGFATEWATESLVRDGTDTWEYFDREVVYQRKFLRKATPMWLKPWMLQLVHGFNANATS